MATISALCMRRSTMETTQAALGKTSRHSANWRATNKVGMRSQIVAQYRGDGHDEVLCGCFRDPGNVAESHDGQGPDKAGHSNGNAIAAGPICPSSPPPS